MKPLCPHLSRLTCAPSDAGRRRFLGAALAVAAGSVTLIAGCGESKEHTASIAPHDIEPGTACSLDGMLLGDYPGPKGQILYAGQDAPDFFCDTTELLNHLLAAEQVRPIRAAWVQDMGQADWDAPRGHWIDARSALYVFGSTRAGSMGPTPASFADAEAAKRFAGQYGGKVLRFDEITRDQVDLSGGALHDSHM